MAELVEAAAVAETVPDDSSKSALLGANYRHHGVALQLAGDAQVRWSLDAHLAPPLVQLAGLAARRTHVSCLGGCSNEVVRLGLLMHSLVRGTHRPPPCRRSFL
jgi:hypothetical protein